MKKRDVVFPLINKINENPESTIRVTFLMKQIEMMNYQRAAIQLVEKGKSRKEISKLVCKKIFSNKIVIPEKNSFPFVKLTITDVLQAKCYGLLEHEEAINILIAWPYDKGISESVELVDGYPLDNTFRELDAGVVNGLLEKEEFDFIKRENKKDKKTRLLPLISFESPEKALQKSFFKYEIYKNSFYRELISLYKKNMTLTQIGIILQIEIKEVAKYLKQAKKNKNYDGKVILTSSEEIAKNILFNNLGTDSYYFFNLTSEQQLKVYEEIEKMPMKL